MSFVPHVLPYLLFVAIGAGTAHVPDEWAAWVDPLRTILVGSALVWFWRRGSYPELAACEATGRVSTRSGATLLAIAAGLAVGLLWIPLATALPLLGEGGRAGFDPDAGALLPRVILRIVGSVAFVPFAEELFVRSFLPRRVDVVDGDWRDRPVGVFTLTSFAVSVGFFTLTHPEWLAALVAAVLWTVLLIATRRLRDAVLAHAIANAILAAHVLISGEWHWW